MYWRVRLGFTWWRIRDVFIILIRDFFKKPNFVSLNRPHARPMRVIAGCSSGTHNSAGTVGSIWVEARYLLIVTFNHYTITYNNTPILSTAHHFYTMFGDITSQSSVNFFAHHMSQWVLMVLDSRRRRAGRTLSLARESRDFGHRAWYRGEPSLSQRRLFDNSR